MMGLRFAYGTNGLTDHRLADALAMLADSGYAGVALTMDHAHLDPLAPDLMVRVRAVGRQLRRLGLAVVIETGGRFVLDPRRKHEPTLLSEEGRGRRLDLLRTAVRVAVDLEAGAVHLWSGRRPTQVSADVAWARLVDGCALLLADANRAGVPLAFEPEPGMLVADLADFERLATDLAHHPQFGLTLDLGHCVCVEDQPVAACVRRAAAKLVHVQIEDMRRGEHEHLMFGEGDLDLPAALAALHDVAYRGLVSVELTRHSHMAHTVVPRAIDVLRMAEREVLAA